MGAKCAGIVSDMKEKRDAWVERAERERWNLNLLVDDLYVIDLDTPEAVCHFESEIRPKFSEEFATCPVQQTRKGFHYFFVRPKGCTHFNKARAYRKSTSDAALLEIDCCTAASTGTRGNINVYPSTNKIWLRSLHDYPPKVMSGRLYSYLDQRWAGLKNRAAAKCKAPAPTAGSAGIASGRSERGRARQVVLTDTHTYWMRRIAEESGISQACISWSTPTRGRVDACGRQCLASKEHKAEHDNAFIELQENGNLIYRCLSARCQRSVCIERESA